MDNENFSLRVGQYPSLEDPHIFQVYLHFRYNQQHTEYLTLHSRSSSSSKGPLSSESLSLPPQVTTPVTVDEDAVPDVVSVLLLPVCETVDEIPEGSRIPVPLLLICDVEETVDGVSGEGPRVPVLLPLVASGVEEGVDEIPEGSRVPVLLPLVASGVEKIVDEVSEGSRVPVLLPLVGVEEPVDEIPEGRIVPGPPVLLLLVGNIEKVVDGVPEGSRVPELLPLVGIEEPVDEIFGGLRVPVLLLLACDVGKT